jgi:hypothetical protein
MSVETVDGYSTLRRRQIAQANAKNLAYTYLGLKEANDQDKTNKFLAGEKAMLDLSDAEQEDYKGFLEKEASFITSQRENEAKDYPPKDSGASASHRQNPCSVLYLLL